jgi:nucleoside-diphosphate-sugar epimerase
MSKVLVTGGGYVGSVIIEKLLNRGDDVVCIDNLHKGNCDHLFPLLKDFKNFRFVKGDINHKEDVEELAYNSDIIFNTASIVGFPACKKHQVLAKETHTTGVLNLIEEQKSNGVFVQFSTDSIYGMNDKFCDEYTEPNPQSLYGETKLIAEEIVSNYDNSLILRFSTGMGVSNVMRCNLLVNDLVYSAVTTGSISVFEPNVSRSFINVDDMAEAAIYFGDLALQDKNEYTLYNIGHDELNYTKGELAKVISDVTGCKVESMSGKDADCRDYKISHQRQYEAGFVPKKTMVETIEDLERAVPLLSFEQKYQ